MFIVPCKKYVECIIMEDGYIQVNPICLYVFAQCNTFHTFKWYGFSSNEYYACIGFVAAIGP